MRVDASGVDLVRVDFVEVDLVAPNLASQGRFFFFIYTPAPLVRLAFHGWR